MADEPIIATPETAAPVAEPAAVVEAPVAVVEAPIADAAPAEVNAFAEPTLLEAFTAKRDGDAKPDAKPEGGDQQVEPKADAPAADAKPADKPADAPKPEAKPDDKPVDAKPEDAPKPDAAPLPAVEYKYTLPETIKMDDGTRTEFHTALDKFRADPVEGGQDLINLHNKAMTNYAEHLNREQHRIFAETRKSWRTAVMADEILGGAGYKTAMQTVASARDMFASAHKPGTEEYNADLRAFDGMMLSTGVGDHPVFLRLLHNIGRFSAEPSPPPRDHNPPPDNGKQAKGKSPLYDHPRSPGNRQ